MTMVIGKDKDETIRLTAELLGLSLAQAAMLVAIELGESHGDLIVIDEQGREVPEQKR